MTKAFEKIPSENQTQKAYMCSKTAFLARKITDACLHAVVNARQSQEGMYPPPAHNMPFLLCRISDNIQSNLLRLTSRCLQRFPRLKLIQMNVLMVHRSKPERKIKEFQTVSVEQDGEVFSVVRVDVKQ